MITIIRFQPIAARRCRPAMSARRCPLTRRGLCAACSATLPAAPGPRLLRISRSDRRAIGSCRRSAAAKQSWRRARRHRLDQPDCAHAAPPNGTTVVAGLPPEDQPETGAAELPQQLHRQLVDYATSEPAGTIVIDTPHTFLYLVLGRGKALRYGVGVGRDGFTWSGTERISHMSQWPDWHPPKKMIERQPYLPRFMAGGEGNPLGARALYLGNTVYRIHGTNQPSTIGTYVSSGCIRLTNQDIEDLTAA